MSGRTRSGAARRDAGARRCARAAGRPIWARIRFALATACRHGAFAAVSRGMCGGPLKSAHLRSRRPDCDAWMVRVTGRGAPTEVEEEEGGLFDIIRPASPDVAVGLFASRVITLAWRLPVCRCARRCQLLWQSPPAHLVFLVAKRTWAFWFFVADPLALCRADWFMYPLGVQSFAHLERQRSLRWP